MDEVWQWVAAAQRGDRDAFGRIYSRYYDDILSILINKTHDKPLAEDLTQEAFLRAWRRINSVSYQGKDVVAWLFTIAMNLLLDHIKSSRYKLEIIHDDFGREEEPSPGPESVAILRERNRELLITVSQLSVDQQQCLHWRYFEDKSILRTAELMSKGEGAVKALQYRATRKLAATMMEAA